MRFCDYVGLILFTRGEDEEDEEDDEDEDEQMGLFLVTRRGLPHFTLSRYIIQNSVVRYGECSRNGTSVIYLGIFSREKEG